MKEPVAASHSGEEEDTRGWTLPALLFGVIYAIFRFGGACSWWALLWAPLLVFAVGYTAYEWRLMARSNRRMSAWGWSLLIATHLGAAAVLAVILGFLHI